MNCINGKEKHRHKFLKVTGMVSIGIAAAVFFALIFGYIVQLLWNWLMPEIFGLKTITYWQGFAIVILSKILFGGYGRRHHEHHDGYHEPWHRFKRFGKNGFGRHGHRKYFEKFWDEEGKAAFENYVKRNEEKQA